MATTKKASATKKAAAAKEDLSKAALDLALSVLKSDAEKQADPCASGRRRLGSRTAS